MVSLCNMQHYVIYNYMFRPSKWAIRLFLEPVSWLYNRSLSVGDEISSYIISSGVSIACIVQSTYWFYEQPDDGPLTRPKHVVVWILGNCPTWRTYSFQCIYLFIVLYMFRACHAHHQEKQIVSIQLLVIVTPCWWQCRVLVGSKLPHTTKSYTVLYTIWLSAEAIDLGRPYWIPHPVSCHTPEAVTAVFKWSWGWKQKASETCRVLLQLLINILPSCITLVLYVYINLWCTETQT